MLYSSLGKTFLTCRDKNTPSGACEAKQTPPSLVLHKQLDEQTLMTTPSASLKGQRAAARFQVNEGICVRPAGALLRRHCRRGLDPVYTVWVCVVVGLLLDLFFLILFFFFPLAACVCPSVRKCLRMVSRVQTGT